MKKIKINQQIFEAAPKIQLGIIEAEITFTKYNHNLWLEIKQEAARISKMTTQDIKKIPTIFTTRDTYKKLGKEPSRYRPSAEALHRRIVQGKEMYKISTPVDIINLISLKTGYSIGGYDCDKIKGEIIFAKANTNEQYHAIARGLMNIENLPAFFDDFGAFGSPTSDSERTKITQASKNIILILMNFGGHDIFDITLEYASSLLSKYCLAKNINIRIIP